MKPSVLYALLAMFVMSSPAPSDQRRPTGKPHRQLSSPAKAREDAHAKLVTYLQARGGIAVVYQRQRSSDPDAPQQLTSLKSPVPVDTLKKSFPKPDTVETRAPSFIGRGGPIPIIWGEHWRYGCVTLFIKDGDVLEFAESHIFAPRDSTNRANRTAAPPANRKEKEGKLEEGAGGVLLSGTGPIRWLRGEWRQAERGGVLELGLAEDSDWSAAACGEKQQIALLVCFVPNSAPGDATKLVEAKLFESEHLAYQSVGDPVRKELEFVAFGGRFSNRKTAPALQGEGTVQCIFGADQLKPLMLEVAKSIRFRLSGLADGLPELSLRGRGRLAAAIMRIGNDVTRIFEGQQLSNVIEIPVSFEPTAPGATVPTSK